MKKVFIIFLSLVFIISLFSPIGVVAKDKNNITTTLDDEGVLIVSGTGEVHELLRCGGKNEDRTVRHVIIKEGITGIYDSFVNVQFLTTISFPETLEVISNCFQHCPNISNLVFPKSLKRIENGSFSGGLTKKIEFNSPVEIIGTPEATNFSFMNFLKEIVFKNGTRIEYSFSYMPEIREAYIPNDCYLKSSFVKLDKLKKVTLGENVYIEPQRHTKSEEPSFTYCHESLIIYVDKMTDNYEKALPWQEFRIVGTENDARSKQPPILVWIVVDILLYTIILFIVLIFIKKKTRA